MLLSQGDEEVHNQEVGWRKGPSEEEFHTEDGLQKAEEGGQRGGWQSPSKKTAVLQINRSQEHDKSKGNLIYHFNLSFLH